MRRRWRRCCRGPKRSPKGHESKSDAAFTEGLSIMAGSLAIRHERGSTILQWDADESSTAEGLSDKV